MIVVLSPVSWLLPCNTDDFQKKYEDTTPCTEPRVVWVWSAGYIGSESTVV